MQLFHFQYNFQQAKYVNVLKGKILDCVVDLRKNSKTFGKVFKIILSDKNCLSLFIPKGFAHAYYSYDEDNIIYSCYIDDKNKNRCLVLQEKIKKDENNNVFYFNS